MPSLKLGIWATVIYTAMIAVATLLTFQQSRFPTDVGELLLALFPIQFVAVVFCCVIVSRWGGWSRMGFGPIRWSGVIWLLPSWLVLGAIGWVLMDALTLSDFRDIDRQIWILLLVTPLLIAFGEEVLFRGILLRGAMTRLTLPGAMMTSAVFFGLFHLVNGLSGRGLSETSQQVLFAVLVGFYLAPIALRIGNLWPLIIWHWLWNVAVFLSQHAGVTHPFIPVGIAIQLVISFWLWRDLMRRSHAP